jgi:hypothetical protein
MSRFVRPGQLADHRDRQGHTPIGVSPVPLSVAQTFVWYGRWAHDRRCGIATPARCATDGPPSPGAFIARWVTATMIGVPYLFRAGCCRMPI